MTLQSAIEAERKFLQSEAEARMTDTCRITRAGAGEPVFNETTGQYDDPAPVTVYEGKCRIPRRDPATAQAATAGEATWKVGEFPLALPMKAAGGADVAVGMTVTYLSSANDAGLAGHMFGITGVARQTDAIERRFRMKEAQG